MKFQEKQNMSQRGYQKKISKKKPLLLETIINQKMKENIKNKIEENRKKSLEEANFKFLKEINTRNPKERKHEKSQI